ncbi:hypothetical protein M493_08775 [Geobacillus genomosp. 3]|uniref:DUF2642 domain-containing protein n=1 Tax=Geobacillus genomosp. 3 TaxID=1921421 RepID=S5ZCU6_GEOG3|nr:hypothetical protein [Geobacillus genomosp. 3]AGT32030.1 hypothetical protein M493_08775 [Geobacillus genomosp. 3]
MDLLKTLLGKQVKVEISGGTVVRGVLIDFGLDILVLYTGKEYLYIPHLHIHHIQLHADPEFLIDPPFPEVPLQEDTGISYRKTLLNAKGRFVEIYVIGNKSIHGYITNVLNDYFTFYSPVYKTMLISLNHLKWLTPYQTTITPYTLGNDALPVQPTPLSLQRSLEEQLKKMEGHLAIFDLGDHPLKIGLLKEVQNNIVHLVTAGGESVYWKVIHLKTVHFPS